MKTQLIWCVFALLLTTPLASFANDQPPRALRPLTMECRLNVDSKSASDLDRFAGSIALKNTSTEPITIKYRMSPLEFLDFDVKDAKGATLPKSLASYGFIFSPIFADDRHRFVLTIQPGETFRHPVSPCTQVDTKNQRFPPGKYTIEARYRGTTAFVRSNQVTVELTAK